MSKITTASALAALFAGCLLSNEKAGSGKGTVTVETGFQGEIINLIDWSRVIHDTTVAIYCKLNWEVLYDGPCQESHTEAGFYSDTVITIATYFDTLGVGIDFYPEYWRGEDPDHISSGMTTELYGFYTDGDSTRIQYQLRATDTSRVDYYFLDEYDSTYYGQKTFPGRPCNFSFSAKVVFDLDGATIDAPLVFSEASLRTFDVDPLEVEVVVPTATYYLVIDEEKSKPPVFSSVDFFGKPFEGTVSITCPLP